MYNGSNTVHDAQPTWAPVRETAVPYFKPFLDFLFNYSENILFWNRTKIRKENSLNKVKINKISSVIHYPDKPSEKLAILLPGYLDSKDYPHLIALAEDLKNDGYTAVRFDPTGTWESGGDISDYTITQYLKDIKNVLEYMLQQKDYRRILLGGHSRGGMVSILYAARDPRISNVVGIMSSSGPIEGKMREEWQKTGIRTSYRDLPDKKDQRIKFNVPFSHAEDRDKYNVVEDVKKVKVPIILVAGELDDLVLPDDVREIFSNANEPKKFVIVKGIDHDYRLNNQDIKKVNREIIDWLNQFLRPIRDSN